MIDDVIVDSVIQYNNNSCMVRGHHQGRYRDETRHLVSFGVNQPTILG